MEKNEKKDEEVEKEIKEINEEIKKKKLRWTAGKTSLSKLSKIERRTRLGLAIEEDELKRMVEKQKEREKKRIVDLPHPSPVDPPSRWDWRDDHGINWTTNIKNQGRCGSCVAFACVAVLEMMTKRWVYRDATIDPALVNFSEGHLYFINNRHCLLYDCHPPPLPDHSTCANPDYAWNITPALNYMKANSISYETCYPYGAPNICNTCNRRCKQQIPPGGWTAGQPCALCNQVCNQPITLCPEWPYFTLSKIKNWAAIYGKDEMKRVLSEHGCLVTGFVVYEDFMDYTGGIYEHATGDKLGGHAVAVVGYDDVDDCWICKNSWGLSWGEAGGGEPGGWFRIAYNECAIDEVMYKIDLFCPAEEAGRSLGLNDERIGMVRSFRDALLTTRKGRAYLDLALENIGLVTSIDHMLKRNKKLRIEAESVLKPFINAILTKDSFKPFRLKEEHFDNGIRVMKKMAELDRRLLPFVRVLQRDAPKYIGKNVREIMRELF